MKRETQFRRLLFSSHRYMGLTSAFFIILLSISGIMLNHTEALKMDEKHLQAPALLNWYGIKPAEIGYSFKMTDHWLTEVQQRLILNEQPLNTGNCELVGALIWQQMIIAACQNSLLLLTLQGETIEQLNALHGIPQGITHLGVDTQQQIVLRTDQQNYQGDMQLLEWSSSQAHDIRWLTPSALPKPLSRQLQQNYQGEGISLERVVLDLHSGRILGHWGVYLMDLMAILFLLLAGMGVWMWSWRKRHHKPRKQLK